MDDVWTSSVFGAAAVFGFRHGFDWDHIAALSDLTGSQRSARRSMWLATLYALGHAAMVLVLGVATIVLASGLPARVDRVMEPVVGLTLLALGVYLAWSLVRHRGAQPPRSTTMLLVEGLRRAAARLRRAREAGIVVVEHEHPHDHTGPGHGHGHAPDHGREHAHEHGHPRAPEHAHEHEAVGATGALPLGAVIAVAHSHRHRHVATMPRDPFAAYGTWSSLGVGMLHGIGAETPTQVLVLATAAHAGGKAQSMAVLVCFLAGLVLANTVVAAAATFGFRRAATRRTVLVALTALTAGVSATLGAHLVLQHV